MSVHQPMRIDELMDLRSRIQRLYFYTDRDSTKSAMLKLIDREIESTRQWTEGVTTVTRFTRT